MSTRAKPRKVIHNPHLHQSHHHRNLRPDEQRCLNRLQNTRAPRVHSLPCLRRAQTALGLQVEGIRTLLLCQRTSKTFLATIRGSVKLKRLLCFPTNGITNEHRPVYAQYGERVTGEQRYDTVNSLLQCSPYQDRGSRPGYCHWVQ